LKINSRTVRYRLCDLESYQDAQPVGGEGTGPTRNLQHRRVAERLSPPTRGSA
jgi:hypothetical protein